MPALVTRPTSPAPEPPAPSDAPSPAGRPAAEAPEIQQDRPADDEYRSFLDTLLRVLGAIHT
ncbi:MAG TPA: hypothetical protein VM597_02470 [Gemmataceae bacterium]|jgi:hypothetical protein|nr:hypothetical protein [Gemmataceae bacterium]